MQTRASIHNQSRELIKNGQYEEAIKKVLEYLINDGLRWNHLDLSSESSSQKAAKAYKQASEMTEELLTDKESVELARAMIGSGPNRAFLELLISHIAAIYNEKKLNCEEKIDEEIALHILDNLLNPNLPFSSNYRAERLQRMEYLVKYEEYDRAIDEILLRKDAINLQEPLDLLKSHIKSRCEKDNVRQIDPQTYTPQNPIKSRDKINDALTKIELYLRHPYKYREHLVNSKMKNALQLLKQNRYEESYEIVSSLPPDCKKSQELDIAILERCYEIDETGKPQLKKDYEQYKEQIEKVQGKIISSLSPRNKIDHLVATNRYEPADRVVSKTTIQPEITIQKNKIQVKEVPSNSNQLFAPKANKFKIYELDEDERRFVDTLNVISSELSKSDSEINRKEFIDASLLLSDIIRKKADIKTLKKNDIDLLNSRNITKHILEYVQKRDAQDVPQGNKKPETKHWWQRHR